MIKPTTICNVAEKRFIGFTTVTSIVNDRTFEIWSKLMPRRGEIESLDSSKRYSLQVFPEEMTLLSFNPVVEFRKWALIEATSEAKIPDGMVEFILASGKYAVFEHYGIAADFPSTMNEIITNWLPESSFLLDTNRPHFEVLDERYLGPQNKSSVEEVWIPIW